MGKQTLKNIDRPVLSYAVVWDDPSPFPRGGRAAAGSHSPPRLSIVVLPFANLGGDPEQDYFVDGVTESLTTDLSRISGSFVIGRHTAFTYKGKTIDIKKIGRELNVRYVLEGSVQRSGSRLRVRAPPRRRVPRCRGRPSGACRHDLRERAGVQAALV